MLRPYNVINQIRELQTSTMIIRDVENNTLDSSNNEGVDRRAQSKKEK